LEKDPPEDSVANFTDGCNKKLWIESIQQYFALRKGQALVPLLYVIRLQEAVPAVDPGFGLPSFEEDIESRGRLDGQFWRADNRAVWLFLKSKCHGTTAWTTIVEHQRAANGRGAFLALVNQYLGRDVQRSLLKKAVTTLEKLTFDGRSRNWTFDKFVGSMRQCFVDMGEANQLSEERKVMALQSAWQVPGLGHLDAMMQQNYNDDFNGAVTFLGEQMANLKLKNGAANRTVAAATTQPAADSKRKLKAMQRAQKRSGGKFRGKSDKDSHARKKPNAKYNAKDPKAYVSKQAWSTMSEDEKATARRERAAAGIPQRDSKSNTAGGSRAIGSLTTVRTSAVASVPTPMDIDEDARTVARANLSIQPLSDDEDDARKMPPPARIIPPARVIPPQVLVAPRVQQLVTTQRVATYASKPSSQQPNKSTNQE